MTPEQNKSNASHSSTITLAIDIGGSGIKGLLLNQSGHPMSERVRMVTPKPATPQAIVPLISDIAEKEELSVPYASKLLAILRRADLVSAARGRGGGFQISRKPSEINLLEVITALGGPLIDEEHCQKFSGQKDTCVHTGNCSVMFVLGGLAGYIGDFLASTTLEDIINGDVLSRVQKIESKLPSPASNIEAGKVE